MNKQSIPPYIDFDENYRKAGEYEILDDGSIRNLTDEIISKVYEYKKKDTQPIQDTQEQENRLKQSAQKKLDILLKSPIKHLYDNGLPFSDVLKRNIDSIYNRIRKKKAGMIVIDGGVGEGKTTLQVEILDEINKKEGLPPIEISKTGPQLGLGGADFTKKLRECHELGLPCIGYDEAGDFSRRGSLTQFNAMMNRTFETFRAFKCLVIIALPNFDVLDQQLLDNRIPRMLLHLKGRTERTGNFYGYSLHNMNWLKYNMSKMKIKNYAFKRVQPNFYGHFLDLSKERSILLDRVSIANKMSILKKSEIKLEGLMDYPELATKLMKSIVWVRNAVAVLKIKEARSIGRSKYFDAVALNQLAEHVTMMQDKRRGLE